MNSLTYPGRNLTRRKGRTILTVIAVAVTVLIFNAIRTVDVNWKASVEDAMADRLVTRHKASITLQLPKRYIEDVRAIPGVARASWGNWFDAKDPLERVPFFQGLAVDHATWFDVFDDMVVDPKVLAEWKQTPNGVIVGDKIAEIFKVKPGDKMTIASGIYAGTLGQSNLWEFQVVGFYYPSRRTVDRNSVILRWDYLNNDPRAVDVKDQIGWVMTRIAGGTNSAEMSRKIDAAFDIKDDQTITMSEKTFNLQFLGAFGAVMTAFDLVSIVILLFMILILANTIAMNVRERTHEYGVLRAIGFPPRSIFGFIVGESVLVALVGGLLGIAITYVLVNLAIGPALAGSPMGAMFPYFRAPLWLLGVSLGLAVALGLIAGLVPARRASRLRVTDALRRID